MRYAKRTIVFATAAAALFFVVPPAFAALDIFDHPRTVERKSRVENTRREGDAAVLAYPDECILKEDYAAAFSSCQKLLAGPVAGDSRLKGDLLRMAGLSCLKLNQYVQARGYYNDILLINGAPDTLKADALLGIADGYFLEQRFDKAFDSYRELLMRYPDNATAGTAYYRLGETAYRLRRPEEALRYLDKLRRDFPLSFEARLADRLANEESSCVLPVSAEGAFTVQVGCYNERGNAESLNKKLKSRGFDAYVAESPRNERPRFRVKVGRCASKDEAQSLEKRLKKAGYPTKICP
ncbi:MAG: SPOR domain-containing protein [Candidatus Omnitrophota bacterium]